ncbi:MAG: GGDEF domain-containing protein, partial [Mobilitalea sp.]
TQYSYETQLDTYDSLTNNTAALLKQEVENNYESIKISANLVAKAGELNENTIKAILPILSENESYLDILIVNTDGIGYNIDGDKVDEAKETYFKKAMQGTTNVADKLSFNSNQEPILIYATPIMEGTTKKGVLLACINARINVLPLPTSELEQGSMIYLLNENNELVSYIEGNDISKFDYNTLIKNGVFLQGIENDSKISSIFRSIIPTENTEKEYIWDRKPIGINNWYVLIGREDVISPATLKLLALTNNIWILIAIGTFFLFAMTIIGKNKSNRKIIRTLYLDPVTGGSNWYKFRINVSKILNSKQFYKKKFAIINFDINRFKIINDAYGYQKGDEVLKDIYYEIRRWAQQGEPFTRYAADQFYILLNFQEESEVESRLYDLNERLHELRYTKAARIFFGVYFITERKDSIDRMGEFAAVAKKNIKGNTDEIISYFDKSAREKLFEEEEIENSMNEALKNNEFQVFLQPKYTVQNETISGAEALVRWMNSDGVMLTPNNFIPIFEKNGFITELDYYMLNKVCEVLRNWIDRGFIPYPISVNISRLHFINPNLADIICEIVDKNCIPHALIELEVTESAFLHNKAALIRTVTLLRQEGFMVSMDDFGAGYSSLNSLKDLPLDIVKLDGEFFQITKEVERGLTVIRNTITMAKDLHMKVVAECIETKEQVEFLYSVGCDVIQGYYYARPMPVDQFEERYFLNIVTE